MRNERYSRDLGTLIALISNLAYAKPFSRKAADKLATDLSIDETSIARVLTTYRSLFKEENNPNDAPEGRGEGEFVYGLHLRNALAVAEREGGEYSRDPLASEHVTTLISFVTRMAADERSSRLQVLAAVLAAVTTILVALIALRGNGC